MNRQIFDSLYRDINGKKISHEGRAKLPYFYIGYTYGEVTYEGFSKMVEITKPKRNEVFYDLGSGTGKAVFIASQCDFSQLVGIEIIKELHESAQNVLNTYKNSPNNKYNMDERIRFINSDFTKTDISDADVLFLNATCMYYELFPVFLAKLEQCKKGTRIITNSVSIRSTSYKIQSVGYFPFTWGNEEVFIHERI